MTWIYDGVEGPPPVIILRASVVEWESLDD